MQDLELDCIIEVTQAPGLSAYNRAERKMYHLSKELSGIVLPAETYGSHLNNGKTVDEELEERNFEAAGEVLSEVWSKMEIDKFSVTAEYVSLKPTEDITGFSASDSYKSRHLIQTQYMTVALKCDDRKCCTAPNTSIHKFSPDRRIPALIPVHYTREGPVALPITPDLYKQDLDFLCVFQRLSMESAIMPKELNQKYNNKVPYDVYFPSLQDKVEDRVCKVCGKYFSLKLLLTGHKRICKRRKQTKKTNKKNFKNVAMSLLDEDTEDEEVSLEEVEDIEEMREVEEELELVELRPKISVPSAGGVETILNLAEWLRSPYQLVSEI